MREEFADDLPELMLDEVKVRQVVTNLLSNAIKFSPPRSTVLVRTAREPRYVRFDVVDEGPGVPPEESSSIFELFGQGVASQVRPDAGVGIGLHLVKRITELHGGHVGVHSGVGKGSTFWVRLPITPAKLAAPEKERQAA
jgi:signal transduction histidine kinase